MIKGPNCNESALNVCPTLTLSRTDIEDPMIYSFEIVVQGFDDTKTSDCEELYLKILVCPCEFEASFVVVDIPTVFNLLLL